MIRIVSPTISRFAEGLIKLSTFKTPFSFMPIVAVKLVVPPIN